MKGFWRLGFFARRIFGENLAKRFPQVTFGEGVILRGSEKFSAGPGCFIDTRAYLSCAGGEWNNYSGYVRLGSNCEIGAYSTIFGAGGITIGDNVHMGSHVSIWANTLRRDVRDGTGNAVMRFAPVKIEDNVIIGANASIGPGVTIGKNSVIGQGSAVIFDVPPDSMAYGVPARVFIKKDVTG